MNVEHYFPELAYLAPGAPDFTFRRAVNVAARTLCQIGLVWQRELMPISWIDGESEYRLRLPPNTRIVQMLSLGGLEPSSGAKLRELGLLAESEQGTPRYYYRSASDHVRVAPIPAQWVDDAVTPYVALAPMNETDEVSDDYAWDYERLLLQGAVAHLGGASWGAYTQACHDARSRAVDKNHVGVPRKVRYGGI